jgi:hypothetical protein
MPKQFNAVTAAEAAHASHAETSNRKNRPKKQAVELQFLLMKDARNPETTPAARAQIARAWRDLQEQVMELDGIGKPRPVPAKNEPAKTKTRPSVL